jgi:nitroreductase
MTYEKITSRRTIRKYAQKSVPREVLLKCVDAARLSPSGANRQPLKYIVVNDQELIKEVFGTLKFAGYLPGYQEGEHEMPRAYIVMLLDKSISENVGHDGGIAATAKHFPGRGDSATDAHDVLDVIRADKKRMSQIQIILIPGLINHPR